MKFAWFLAGARQSVSIRRTIPTKQPMHAVTMHLHKCRLPDSPSARPRSCAKILPTLARIEWVYGAGATHAWSGWTVGLGWTRGDYEGVTGANGVGPFDADHDIFSATVSYELGPGISLDSVVSILTTVAMTRRGPTITASLQELELWLRSRPVRSISTPQDLSIRGMITRPLPTSDGTEGMKEHRGWTTMRSGWGGLPPISTIIWTKSWTSTGWPRWPACRPSGHRIYHAIHGETIAATVKRLRLHRAAGRSWKSISTIRGIRRRQSCSRRSACRWREGVGQRVM